MPYRINCRSTITKISCQSFVFSESQTSEQRPLPIKHTKTSMKQHVSSKPTSEPKRKSRFSMYYILVMSVAFILMAGIIIRTIIYPPEIPYKGPTPRVSMNWAENPEMPGFYSGNVVSISGVSGIETDDVEITFTHNESSTSIDLDDLDGSSITVGSATLFFNDLSPIRRLGAEDIFRITGGVRGDVIRLVFKPSKGQMCSTTLT